MLDSQTRKLAELWRREGKFSSVFIDANGLSDGPGQDAESRRRQVRDTLERAGAPEADLATVESILSEPTGVGGTVSRFLLVHNGEAVLDEVLAGPRVWPEITAYLSVPDLLPLVRYRQNDVVYLVVEASRGTADIHAYRASHNAALHSANVEGRTDSLNKVQAGGWAHSRYQHHSEEIWKQNQSQLAAAIDDFVRQLRPRFVLLAGDVRAVQLLTEELAPASREISHPVPAHVLAPGSSRAALEQRVSEKLEEIRKKDQSAALDKLAAGDFEYGSLGIGAVAHALQQSQADTVLIDETPGDGRVLLALASEPWVATAPEEAMGAQVLEPVPALLALTRAAVLTESKVMFVDHGLLPKSAEVAAVLRWPTGPAIPGTPRWQQEQDQAARVQAQAGA
ncbi:Vms1/Ankzf1 family peptidyl-tRNA hydrolase [Mycetocola zhadangensis]|uniref:baeRF2 domain-containing protein n=1 Tax=Mycetocola zhadangensis TaxID=1164595 RepID=UPI003A4D3EFC